MGRQLSAEELSSFDRYLHVLLEWNRVHNLVGLDDPLRVVRTLFVESLLLTPLVPSTARTLVDVGSGAGVPGVPIRIVAHELEVTLVESRRKRASFLFAVRRELDMPDIRVWHGRAEDLAESMPAAGFDVVTMRAVGEVERSLKLGAPLVGPNGRLLAGVALGVDRGRVEEIGTQYGLRASIEEVAFPQVGLRKRVLLGLRQQG
jgi:16S rRNA (guanine527-N7)-methyltransferase